MVELWLGLDKICLEKKLSKMGSQKKEAILQAKWAANFVKKAKWLPGKMPHCLVRKAILWSPPNRLAKTGMLQLRESFQFYSALNCVVRFMALSTIWIFWTENCL